MQKFKIQNVLDSRAGFGDGLGRLTAEVAEFRRGLGRDSKIW